MLMSRQVKWISFKYYNASFAICTEYLKGFLQGWGPTTVGFYYLRQLLPAECFIPSKFIYWALNILNLLNNLLCTKLNCTIILVTINVCIEKGNARGPQKPHICPGCDWVRHVYGPELCPGHYHHKTTVDIWVHFIGISNRLLFQWDQSCFLELHCKSTTLH